MAAECRFLLFQDYSCTCYLKFVRPGHKYGHRDKVTEGELQ